jgi:hypothetical protein
MLYVSISHDISARSRKASIKKDVTYVTQDVNEPVCARAAPAP